MTKDAMTQQPGFRAGSLVGDPDDAWNDERRSGYLAQPTAVAPAPEAVSPEGEGGWLSQSIEAAKEQIAADPERHDAIRRNLGLDAEQPDSRSGAGEKLGFNPFGTGLSEPRIGPAPAQTQQPGTLAEGLEVALRRLNIDANRFALEERTPQQRDIITVLHDHAEAKRLLAERDREIGGLRADLAEANANGASHWSRALAAEADAAKLREALTVARCMAENAAYNLHQAGITPDTASPARAFEDIERNAREALAQTKERP